MKMDSLLFITARQNNNKKKCA
uniref:Uncharacterized protein n=1 Tax=Anguilla anguilla TaxID=7936 RepID=A0A0E9W0A4_ANGAN